MNSSVEKKCQCQCGASSLILTQTPRTRFYCHCLTCQEVYGLPFADVVAVRFSSVTLDEDNKVEYKKYSENLARGVCSECESPVVSFLTIAPFLKIAFMPTASLPDSVEKPRSNSHIYYHRASEPVNDDIPKVSGSIKSNLKIMPALIVGLLGN